MLAAVIAVLLLVGCTSGPTNPPDGGGDNLTNGTIKAPMHSPNEVTAYLQKHLIVYYGITNAEITAPTYSAGEWSTDVRFGENGNPQVLRVLVSDDTLVLKEMWLKVLLNKEPAGIIPIPGKVSCSEGPKVKVIEFANPYCPNCVLSEKAVGAFRSEFNESMDYEYRAMLPKSNTMIDAYGYANVSLTSKYYVCAQEQGLLDGFRKCVMERYAKEPGKPLAENWLDSCAIDEGLNVTKAKSCVANADRLLDIDMKLGQTYLGGYAQLPTFVVDCRFKTSNPSLIRYAVCYEFPKTAGC